LFGWIE